MRSTDDGDDLLAAALKWWEHPDPPIFVSLPATAACGDARGTTAGYWRHYKVPERTCADCRAAINESERVRQRAVRARRAD